MFCEGALDVNYLSDCSDLDYSDEITNQKKLFLL